VDEPDRSISRRWLLRIGGLLGLGATGIAVSGTAGAAPGTGGHDSPDPTGSFGKPTTVETARRQRRRAGQAGVSRADVAPGVATGPDPSTVLGARLSPSRAAIDHTPLARREPRGGSWTTGG
jgi:hypothetical protein